MLRWKIYLPPAVGSGVMPVTIASQRSRCGYVVIAQKPVFFHASSPALALARDPADPDTMKRPPQPPETTDPHVANIDRPHPQRPRDSARLAREYRSKTLVSNGISRNCGFRRISSPNLVFSDRYRYPFRCALLARDLAYRRTPAC